MGKVKASASAQLATAPDRVLSFLRDYRDNRPRIVTDNYTAYRVEQGGKGDGTVYAYHFAAGGRGRAHRPHPPAQGRGGARPGAPDRVWWCRSVWPGGPAPGGSRVTLESSWDGAGGIAGVFEGFFAPKGLRRIYAQMLAG